MLLIHEENNPLNSFAFSGPMNASKSWPVGVSPTHWLERAKWELASGEGIKRYSLVNDRSPTFRRDRTGKPTDALGGTPFLSVFQAVHYISAECRDIPGGEYIRLEVALQKSVDSDVLVIFLNQLHVLFTIGVVNGLVNGMAWL